MVNTFLVHYNFDINAKYLDIRRLGKQRVEAYQILDLCKALHFLAKLYSSPIPSNPYLYHDWIRAIASRFKKEGCHYLLREHNLSYSFTLPSLYNPDLNVEIIYHPEVSQTHTIYKIFNKNTEKVSFSKISKKNRWRKQTAEENIVEVNNGMITLEKKGKRENVPAHNFVYRHELYITLGFVYHPVVPMWLGYETALKAYINSCITEWESLGYTNTMKKYDIDENYEVPIWIYDQDLHENHISNLVTKEIERRENPWYQFLFPGRPTHIEYFWPYSKKYDSSQKYIDFYASYNPHALHLPKELYFPQLSPQSSPQSSSQLLQKQSFLDFSEIVEKEDIPQINSPQIHVPQTMKQFPLTAP